jgi:glycosyltransferase involved in cell wall biosynthesis
METEEIPLVSISCMTFNHELFIRDALEGFVMQKTNFGFEVLIHDDASTDRTAEIIREYAFRFPKLIKPIYQVENQWQKGNRGSGVHNFPRARGMYIALCEGDDFWTDEYKLQRQVDFLNANPAYSMVCENGLIVNTVNNYNVNFNTMPEGDVEIITMLQKRQFPTASVMFRAKFLDEEYYKLNLVGDTILWCYLAMRGKVRYLENISSVYRRGLHGLVESTGKLKWAQLMEAWNEEISRILPVQFNRKIFKTKNFEEYMHAFFASVKEKKARNALVSIKKCFKYEPVRTVKTLIAIVIK